MAPLGAASPRCAASTRACAAASAAETAGELGVCGCGKLMYRSVTLWVGSASRTIYAPRHAATATRHRAWAHGHTEVDMEMGMKA